jgi:chitodextrinase
MGCSRRVENTGDGSYPTLGSTRLCKGVVFAMSVRVDVLGRHLARLGVLVVAAPIVLGGALAAGAAKPPRPPDTVIDSGPSGATNATAATLAFHSTITPATFTCQLDGGAPTACSSPRSVSGLVQGSHTFSVFATSGGLSDTSPDVAAWLVDVTAPAPPTNLLASAPTQTAVVLSWTAASDSGGSGMVGYTVLRDGATLSTVGMVTDYTDTTVAAASTHTYAVRARDAAGNVSSSSVPVTVTTPAAGPAPDTIIDSKPATLATSTTATFGFHSTITPATFTCTLDAGAPAICTSPRTYTNLAQGLHTFTVTATAGGTLDPTPAIATWTVDTVGPTSPGNLVASASATSVALSWAASTDTNGVLGYDVYRDGALLASLGPVTTYTDATVMTGTPYLYLLRARDGAGNVSAPSQAVSARPAGVSSAHLTRAPYLTDLVGLHVVVNFATDRSGTTASVIWGSVSAGVCVLGSAPATASRVTVSVAGVFEYQWKASLTLPSTGTYCYRPYLGPTDLLGTNPSPQFTTQLPLGSNQAFSFVVFGDWGQVDANGANQAQANLITQIAKSGARFAVTTGDNGYPAGSQQNYGDLQQSGADTSAIFGPSFWPVAGASVPLFAAVGNHGLARSDAVHPQFANWPEDLVVSSSGGRYQRETYASVNGSAVADYPSAWYAFDAGGARFYVLDAAWADNNAAPGQGTGTAYENEAASHWAPTSPEYLWLQADLAAHPSGLKFAFFHYPMYSDQPSENSDTSLQGPASLQGLLTTHNVNMAFSGHAHIYQRSSSGGPKPAIVYYTTGGGGALAQSTGACGLTDQYAVGWSYTGDHGTACGSAPLPTSDAQVYHFLKVSVSGSSVTVTPTDSTGRTFDVRTYSFTTLPDTYLDTTPPVGATSSTATFTFHASAGGQTSFACSLDGAVPSTCSNPKTYTGLAQQAHTFSVRATIKGVQDPIPATYTWTVDSTPPGAPPNLATTAVSAFSVGLGWNAASDNTGVTGYDLYRDGVLFASLGAVTTYTDSTVLGGSTHTYFLKARDIAGNVSPASATVTVSTPQPPPPVFADGFESGDLSTWTSTNGLAVQSASVHAGTHAAEGDTTTGSTYAKKTLGATYPDAYARMWFNVIAQPDQVDLLRLRDDGGASLGYAYIETTGQLGWHNDALGTNALSALTPNPGWHSLELHLKADPTPGPTGVVEIWLDNVLVADLSSTAVDVGSAPAAALQIGGVQGGLTYDVAFDDVAFGASRLGPTADANPPSVPAGVSASATSAFVAQLWWSASTDDVAIAGYDVFRDGILLATLGPVLMFTDTATMANTTHSYTVRARDVSGNVSAQSAPVPVTQPAAAPPVFADGFEGGDLAAWTTSAGMTVQGVDVRSGVFAADAATTTGTTYAKKALPAAYPDAYARTAFLVKDQTSQVTLLRLRDTPTGAGGYLYLTASGRLAFRSDALPAGTLSSIIPGPGWHVLELHLLINGGSSVVETWLDGAPVAELSFASIDLGTAMIGVLQIGDTASGSWDVVFDDAAFGDSRVGIVVDGTPPSVPGALDATAPGPFTAQLSWSASTDDVAVAGYDVFRDGAFLASTDAATTAYLDTTVLAASTHQYAVRARDSAGNPSALTAAVSVTTPAAAIPVFSDGFETGDLSLWTTTSALVAQGASVHSGSFAAQGTTSGSAAYGKRTLPSSYPDAYARVCFLVSSQASQVTLLRLRDTPTGSGAYVYLTSAGHVALRSDALAAGTVSAASPGAGWHCLELHVAVSGASSVAEVWLDGAPIPDLSSTVDLGAVAAIGVLQIGDTASGTWDVVFDDAAFGTSRLGPTGDVTPPAAPTNLTVVAASAFAVQVAWDASTDDTGVTSYDLFRDGVLLTSLGVAQTSYTDSTVLADSTHAYAVRARDAANNVSTTTTPVGVTLPTAAAPIFADGFEHGDLASWTTTSNLNVQNTTAASGSFAAEGVNSTGNAYAKKTLGATYPDAYARTAFLVQSSSSAVNLLRLRDGSAVSIGYVYLQASGKLAFHNDTTATNSLSAVAPGAGWHSVELHVLVAGANSVVEVWLDGVLVADLSGPAALGTSPAGGLQIGETATQTWDVVFDDVAFGASRLGVGVDATPPSVPANLIATAPTPFAVELSWDAATDDTTGYDILRDGTVIAILGETTSYTDVAVAPASTHAYVIRARDLAGNSSAASPDTPITLPAADAPLFADSFETGDLSQWTSSAGLTATSAAGDVRTGTYAVEANTTIGNTFAKKTLPGTYSDAHLRLAYRLKSQTSQINLLRIRDGAGASLAYLYLDTSGRLNLHTDATNTNLTSTFMPGPGWHVLEWHVVLNGANSTVEVWVDGAIVSALTTASATLGAGPIGAFQIGETQAGRTYDIVLDDAAFSTTRIGL